MIVNILLFKNIIITLHFKNFNFSLLCMIIMGIYTKHYYTISISIYFYFKKFIYIKIIYDSIFL